MKVKIFITGLAFMAISVFANAQNSVPGAGNGNGNCNGTAKCAAFVDTNKNGVCDTYENRTTKACVGKRNGTGKCKGNGQIQGIGKGKNFVDTN